MNTRLGNKILLSFILFSMIIISILILFFYYNTNTYFKELIVSEANGQISSKIESISIYCDSSEDVIDYLNYSSDYYSITAKFISSEQINQNSKIYYLEDFSKYIMVDILIKESLSNMMLNSFFSVTLFCVCILLVSLIFARYLITKLNKPLEVLIGISDTIDKKLLSNMSNNDEIALLAYKMAQKNEQLESAIQQVIQTDKLAYMGKMSAGITHELKNPLGVIKTGILYIKTILSSDSEIDKLNKIDEAVLEIDQGVKRAENIIYSILDFSKISPIDEEEIYILNTLEQIFMLFSSEIIKCLITVNIDIAKDDVAVLNAESFKNIMINLISNAMESMSENGGELRISTKNNDDKTISIIIQDTGVGISEEHLSHIFDSFYTTKSSNNNIGMGLWMVKREVEKYNGKIYVESIVEEGTRFTLVLKSKRRK